MLFVVFLPGLLLYWSYSMDKQFQWPVPQWPVVAVILMVGGLFLILKGMFDLYKYGKGLPMNAYPPRLFVTQGLYAWFSHPIYIGAIVLSIGASLWSNSGSGLYIITPILTLMILSLIYGYERFGIKKLPGNSITQKTPGFALPSSEIVKISFLKRTARLFIIFIPWLVCGYFIDYARDLVDTGAFAKLIGLSNWRDWVSLIWAVPFIYVGIRILIAKTGHGLVQAVITGIIAAISETYLYLVLPAFGVDPTSEAWMMILLSLLTIIVAFCYRQVWSMLQKGSEWVANSRKDWLFFNGHFRIINHSLYSGLAGATGVCIVSYIIGNNFGALILLLCALLGAAMFAQLRWGNISLRRPFGFWGGIMGGMAGLAIIHFGFGIPFSQLTVAGVLSATFSQAIGRFRCLSQGCCHGVLTDENQGIRVWQNQSRVVTLSGWGGKYILITQLYSISFNILLGILLCRIWLSQNVSNWFIIGLYLILTGIERFAEDAYRGEIQTKIARGLKENQWIAITALIMGILITTIPGSASSQPEGILDTRFFIAVFLGGLITAFAMSMDFPKSNLRFSRLSG
jgi:protein-S-isoprenylcysteine O-methyltransferase Ste14